MLSRGSGRAIKDTRAVRSDIESLSARFAIDEL